MQRFNSFSVVLLSSIFVCTSVLSSDEDDYQKQKTEFYACLSAMQRLKNQEQLSCSENDSDVYKNELNLSATQIPQRCDDIKTKPVPTRHDSAQMLIPSEYYKKEAKKLNEDLIEEVLEQCPAEIEDLIDAINDPENESSIRIILSGSPGVGKTTIAKAIAQRTGRNHVIIRGTALSNQYQFSGEQNLARAIEPLLESNEPHVIVIDEMDALKQTHGNKENVDSCAAGTLCSLVDDCEDNPRLVFIGTTNKLKQIPDDLKSRFTVIDVPLPDVKKRETILWYYFLNQRSISLDYECDSAYITSLAKLTKGFSARELKLVVTRARTIARKRDSSDIVLTKADFYQAYKIVKAHIASKKDQWDSITKEFLKNNWYQVISAACSIIGLNLNVYQVVKAEQHRTQDITRAETHRTQDKEFQRELHNDNKQFQQHLHNDNKEFQHNLHNENKEFQQEQFEHTKEQSAHSQFLGYTNLGLSIGGAIGGGIGGVVGALCGGPAGAVAGVAAGGTIGGGIGGTVGTAVSGIVSYWKFIRKQN